MTKSMLRGYVERWALRAAVIAVLLATLLFLASLFVIYIGDEYASPAWNERSVPPARAD